MVWHSKNFLNSLQFQKKNFRNTSTTTLPQNLWFFRMVKYSKRNSSCIGKSSTNFEKPCSTCLWPFFWVHLKVGTMGTMGTSWWPNIFLFSMNTVEIWGPSVGPHFSTVQKWGPKLTIIMWHQAVNTLPTYLFEWEECHLTKMIMNSIMIKKKIMMHMKINLGLFSSLGSIWVHVVFTFNLNIFKLCSSYNKGCGLFAIL